MATFAGAAHTPSVQAADAPGGLPYTGVNIAGGEFFDPLVKRSPVYGKDYIYPTRDQIAYYAHKGVNIIRVPFRWETLQKEPGQPLVEAELKRIIEVVDIATQRGMAVILDPHNYARYDGKVIGSSELPASAFADFWSRLAVPFIGKGNVWFGLVNEPHDMPTEQWVKAANAAIAAIRKTGATNLILVPGNGWSNAGGWNEDWYGTPNARAMLAIRDPGRRFLIEVHAYFDKDGSGKTPDIVSPTIGSERLRGFTEWCRRHKMRAFLGEFAVAPTELGHQVIDDIMHFMLTNRDVWVGFAWWAGGAWWGDHFFSIEPHEGRDKPQMRFLQPYLQPLVKRSAKP